MDDSTKLKRLTPKRPDRELYVPRYRKPRVKCHISGQVVKKDDRLSGQQDRSHELQPEDDEIPYQIAETDFDNTLMEPTACNDENSLTESDTRLGLQENGEISDAPLDAGSKSEPGEVECSEGDKKSAVCVDVLAVSIKADELANSLNESINECASSIELSDLQTTGSESDGLTKKAEVKSDCGNKNILETHCNEPFSVERDFVEESGRESSASQSETTQMDVRTCAGAKEDTCQGRIDASDISKGHSRTKEKTIKNHRKIKIHRKKKQVKDGNEKTKKEVNIEVTSKIRSEYANDDSENAGNDDWFNEWDETGNCISIEAKAELAKLTGIKDPVIFEATKPDIDYYSFNPAAPNLDSQDLSHLTEMYDFSPDLTTSDLSLALQAMGLKDFNIKWVDDTHAIGIFSTTFQAQQAIQSSSLILKIRPVAEGTKETKIKVNSFKDMLLPYKSRPETTAAVARNLVTSALGMKANTTKEQRAAERQQIIAAKERKRQKEKIAKDTWARLDTVQYDHNNLLLNVQDFVNRILERKIS